MFIALLTITARRQLNTWRNDKTLLLNCVAKDPGDFDCHQYLGDYYGFHEKDDALGSKHKAIAAELVPMSNPKALLFKAKIYVFMNKQTEACDVVEYSYRQYLTKLSSISDDTVAADDTEGEIRISGNNKGRRRDFSKLSKFEARLYPATVNNWILCQVLRKGAKGITGIFLRDSLELLSDALKMVNNNYQCISRSDSGSRSGSGSGNGSGSGSGSDDCDGSCQSADSAKGATNDLSSTVDNINGHIATLQKWQNGTAQVYEGSFIW
jgi:hypothetical protein